MSTLRHDNSPTDEIEMGMMPDLSEGLPNEEEMWQKIQQIRSLPITMGEKRRLKAELRVNSKLLFSLIKSFNNFLHLNSIRLHKILEFMG